MKGFFTSRKFRQGTMATAITVVVVAIVVVVNFVATALTDRYSLVLDLTPTKLFSITDETKEYLRGLDKDVTIEVMSLEETFTGGSTYYLQANEVLKKYALESDRITIVYRDLMADPTIAQEYPSLQLSSSSIIVKSEGKVRDVTPSQLYEIETDDYGNGRVAGSKAEQVLTSAILAVTSDKSISVAVVGGHNEEAITGFTGLLSTNNYLIENVNIMTEELDPSIYNAAIIAAPQRDYSEDELKKLDRFLKNDGQFDKTLFYFASSEQTDQPNLDAFLADWGIGIGGGMVYETNASMYISPQDPFMAVIEYAESEYSEKAQAAQLVPLTAYARPVSLLFETKSSVTTSTLLQFSTTAGVATAETESMEPSGPIPYLVMGQSLTYEGTTPLRSQVIAAGSTAFLNAQFLANANMANSEYMLNLMASLTGKEDSIQIQSKAIGSTALNMTAANAIVVGVVLAILFPLAVLISGIVIWARRRHR